VTSEIPTSWFTSTSGHRSSSASFLARKPSFTRSFPSVESCWMQACAQWWFVITSPRAETKLPEHPRARRTEESRTSSSQAGIGAKPWSRETFSDGKASKVHIPSSAAAGTAAKVRASASWRARRRVIRGSPEKVWTRVYEKNAIRRGRSSLRAVAGPAPVRSFDALSRTC